jgi:hypothetical protein
MKRRTPGVGPVPTNPFACFVGESLAIRRSIEQDARRQGLERGTQAWAAYLERQGAPQELTLKTLLIDIPSLIKTLQSDQDDHGEI